MKQYMKELLHQASLIFFLAIFTLSVAGILFSEEASGIFSIRGGLSYAALFQFYLFSILTAAMVTYILNEDRFPHLPFRKRVVFVVGGAYLLTIVFILVFQWFSADEYEAWFMFHLAFFISTLFGYLFSCFLYQGKAEQYGELLQKYKDNRRKEK